MSLELFPRMAVKLGLARSPLLALLFGLTACAAPSAGGDDLCLAAADRVEECLGRSADLAACSAADAQRVLAFSSCEALADADVEEATKTDAVCGGIRRLLGRCDEAPDPWEAARDVDRAEIDLSGAPDPDAPADFTSTYGEPVLVVFNGPEWVIEGPGGRATSTAYADGSASQRRCAHAAQLRLEAMLAADRDGVLVGVEAITRLRDALGRSDALLYNTVDDGDARPHARAGLHGFNPHTVEWRSVAYADGRCALPTLDQTLAFASRCGDFAEGDVRGVEGCGVPGDPYAAAADVTLPVVDLTGAPPPPVPEGFGLEVSHPDDARGLVLNGPEFRQRWSGGYEGFGFENGSPHGQACAHAGVIRLRAIVAHVEGGDRPGYEAFAELADRTEFRGLMYHWVEDVSEGGRNTREAGMWGYQHLVKWTTVAREDGTCELPTLTQVLDFVDACRPAHPHLGSCSLPAF